jgi:hypothetical protein
METLCGIAISCHEFVLTVTACLPIKLTHDQASWRALCWLPIRPIHESGRTLGSPAAFLASMGRRPYCATAQTIDGGEDCGPLKHLHQPVEEHFIVVMP